MELRSRALSVSGARGRVRRSLERGTSARPALAIASRLAHADRRRRGAARGGRGRRPRLRRSRSRGALRQPRRAWTGSSRAASRDCRGGRAARRRGPRHPPARGRPAGRRAGRRRRPGQPRARRRPRCARAAAKAAARTLDVGGQVGRVGRRGRRASPRRSRGGRSSTAPSSAPTRSGAGRRATSTAARSSASSSAAPAAGAAGEAAARRQRRRRVGEPLPRRRQRARERADAGGPCRLGRGDRRRQRASPLRGARARGDPRSRHGRVRRRQPGEPQPSAADHAGLRAAGAAPGTELRLGLVGKAITFDAGGLSLKPAYRMDEMKSDMGGGGAVLAATGAIAELGLPVRILDGRPLLREPAQWPRLPAGRHHHRAQREDDRDLQHRRRGAADPRRRPLVRPRVGRYARPRPRHA